MQAMVLLLLAIAPTRPPGVDGTDAPRVTAPRIDAEVQIDGRLDEPVWGEALRLTGFWQYEPVDQRRAEEQTDVLVWYAADAIHFGIEAYDAFADQVRATTAERDNIDSEDHVIIYLDTFNDRRRSFFFAVNALGIQQDGIRTEGAGSAGSLRGGQIDKNPDFLFESKGRLTPEGYVVEVRIPFKSLRYPSTEPQSWGINFVRKVQRTGYTDTWTNVKRASNSFLIQAGTLTDLQDLRAGLVLEAQPFVTATANGARDEVSGDFERQKVDTEPGVNLYLGMNSLSLNATVNPDFSQVESDVGQVTVNERFALFFPERRPFFLENIDLFSTPNQLVYTRRIVNPIAGGKLTGKFGKMAVAHLTSVDQGLESNALFNVTRLRRDFGTNSVAGVVFTDRSELDSARYNRVAATDMRLNFGELYFVETQLGGSWTGLEDGSTETGTLWKATFDRTGRSWGFNYQLKGFEEDFQADAGFVPRTGIVDGHAFNRFSFYGDEGNFLELTMLFFGPSRIWRYDEFGKGPAIEGDDFLFTIFRLRGGWELQGTAGRTFFKLDSSDYADFETEVEGIRQPYQPLEQVSGPFLELRMITPTYQRLDADVTVRRQSIPVFGEGSAGNATHLSAAVNFRMWNSLRLSFRNTYERVLRTRDGSEFARTFIPRVKVEYQPTRAFFLRLITEYRLEDTDILRDAHTGAPLILDGAPVSAERREGLRMDFLASFEPSPGTVAFFGYGTSYAGGDPFASYRDPTTMMRINDGFFVKLAYQFRR